ncbi:MAG: hypothetical protein JW739_07330 [Opitutales bacterium]|nr:hypothetical protein [Opitutales bacterium]
MYKAFLIALGSVLFSAASLSAQMVPDAPVKNFKLPGFDRESGYRIWELKGSEVVYLDENRVQISDMVLTSFKGDSGIVTDVVIESNKALMQVKESSAEGTSPLRVTGDGFSMVGRDWTWDGKTKILTIAKDARVVFQQELDYLLK